MKDRKIAILSTSQCRRDSYSEDGNTVVSTQPSALLTFLVKEGFTIYLATTRTRFHADLDKFLMELIPPERRFMPDTSQEHTWATSPGLIEPWKRLLDELGIPHPVMEMQENGFTPRITWLDYRQSAEEAGIITGPGGPHMPEEMYDRYRESMLAEKRARKQREKQT